ncbi:unnamed protein product [Trichogramma brassicae]|uniref:Uncharacterized protein n=1 Tax=Trichogramma brassicae TaxID=86971 RepID=A0A6H5IUC0_9HYME|nr:unnamed protein product [Trichogramma brassicae]
MRSRERPDPISISDFQAYASGLNGATTIATTAATSTSRLSCSSNSSRASIPVKFIASRPAVRLHATRRAQLVKSVPACFANTAPTRSYTLYITHALPSYTRLLNAAAAAVASTVRRCEPPPASLKSASAPLCRDLLASLPAVRSDVLREPSHPRARLYDSSVSVAGVDQRSSDDSGCEREQQRIFGENKEQQQQQHSFGAQNGGLEVAVAATQDDVQQQQQLGSSATSNASAPPSLHVGVAYEGAGLAREPVKNGASPVSTVGVDAAANAVSVLTATDEANNEQQFDIAESKEHIGAQQQQQHQTYEAYESESAEQPDDRIYRTYNELQNRPIEDRYYTVDEGLGANESQTKRLIIEELQDHRHSSLQHHQYHNHHHHHHHHHHHQLESYDQRVQNDRALENLNAFGERQSDASVILSLPLVPHHHQQQHNDQHRSNSSDDSHSRSNSISTSEKRESSESRCLEKGDSSEKQSRHHQNRFGCDRGQSDSSSSRSNSNSNSNSAYMPSVAMQMRYPNEALQSQHHLQQPQSQQQQQQADEVDDRTRMRGHVDGRRFADAGAPEPQPRLESESSYRGSTAAAATAAAAGDVLAALVAPLLVRRLQSRCSGSAGTAAAAAAAADALPAELHALDVGAEHRAGSCSSECQRRRSRCRRAITPRLLHRLYAPGPGSGCPAAATLAAAATPRIAAQPGAVALPRI